MSEHPTWRFEDGTTELYIYDADERMVLWQYNAPGRVDLIRGIVTDHNDARALRERVKRLEEACHGARVAIQNWESGYVHQGDVMKAAIEDIDTALAAEPERSEP